MIDSIVKMAIVLEGCATEEQRSVLRFFWWAKRPNIKDIHKEYFMFTVGNICLLRLITTGSR
jgi:hypothetical protein